MEGLSKRNDALDLLKLFSSFMIILIHVPFYGETGTVVRAIARFAVPIFFMTSGFFCYRNKDTQIKKKLLKIFKILILTSAFYNITDFVIKLLSDGMAGVKTHFAVYAQAERWLELILFNRPFSATRLWFLAALVYVYAMHLLLKKLNAGTKTVFVISMIGLIINIVMTEGFSFFGIVLDEHYARNFLLTGYPFFGIGLLLREYREKVIGTKISTCVGMITIGVVLTLISNYFAELLCLYTGSVFVAVFAFILAMKAEGRTYPAFLVRLSASSLGIYILHRPVATVVTKVFEVVGIEKTSVAGGFAIPILVCIVTAVVACVAVRLKSTLHLTKTHKSEIK
ncbi:MAG: acyltransferase [Clostridia bacterium]|nr:acyltransferase [Clostridia bacterium]